MGDAHVIAERFPFADYATVLDAGAAEGGLVVEVARVHPHLRCLGLDLPPVRPVFEEYVAAHGLSDRISFAGGDFFAEPLPSADVIVFGHVLHDWSLEQKQQLLQKAYDALPEDGAVIVFEAMIDDDRSRNAFGLLMSLNMLIETPSGFDYTAADCRGWLEDIGFRETRVEQLAGPDSMVVGIK
jgi:cyclopropane fatty-acyl-phospholipid synthase-like methyltransferase